VPCGLNAINEGCLKSDESQNAKASFDGADFALGNEIIARKDGYWKSRVRIFSDVRCVMCDGGRRVRITGMVKIFSRAEETSVKGCFAPGC
jgi:hypothetical protein